MKPTKLQTSGALSAKKPKRSVKRKLAWTGSGIAVLLVLIIAFFNFGLSMAVGHLLNPSFKGAGDLAKCEPETVEAFGEKCGNLRDTKQVAFNDIKILSINGYELPGWLIKTSENGHGEPKGVVMYAHAGGSDRREATRYINFYLSQGLDVLTFDQSCTGEAPCETEGLSYGVRESRDVFSAYHYLAGKYERVYAMGSSVGASAILMALPRMPKLAGVIAENPYESFKKLVGEAKEAKSMPEFAINNMTSGAMAKGKFDDQANPANALKLSSSVPVLFIHSKADSNTPYVQTEELHRIYTGPKQLWLTEKGDHALIWNAQPAEYEKRVEDFLR